MDESALLSKCPSYLHQFTTNIVICKVKQENTTWIIPNQIRQEDTKNIKWRDDVCTVAYLRIDYSTIQRIDSLLLFNFYFP